MISIRFDSQQDWWVSAKLFERFAKALVNDAAWSPHLEKYLHVTEANGGFDLSFLDPSDAACLIAAFGVVAERERRRAPPNTEDGSYRVTLENLLRAIQGASKPDSAPNQLPSL